MTEPRWRALHAFYSQPQHADALIQAAAQVIAQAAPSAREDWFFIRYLEGGPHVRIRLGERASQWFERVAESVTGACATLAAETGPQAAPLQGYPTTEGRTYEAGSVVEIDYEPEIARYGGTAALPVNERLFRVSTGLCVGILRSVETPRARAQVAVDLMLATAGLLGKSGESTGRFFADYAGGWERFLDWTAPTVNSVDRPFRPRLEEHRRYAASSADPKTAAQKWIAAAVEARERFLRLAEDGSLLNPRSGLVVGDEAGALAAVDDMFRSHIHMTNNRLGFGPHQEVVWAWALASLDGL